MQTVQIDKSKAIEAYNQTDESGKKLLELLLGDQLVLKITDRVKSFEDACTVLGIKPAEVLPSLHPSMTKDAKSIHAYIQLVIIARALNQGWEPDWDDTDEYKYYPWFYMSASGFRLYGVYYINAHSCVGSRLCFKSEELAEYAVAQFTDLYKDFFIL
jgi:hypothetical protein